MEKTEQPGTKNVKASKRKETPWETLKTVLWAVAIAVVVRTLAYEPFSIPSGSMIPTLLIGDYLFVSKFSYGYSRYSLPFNLPLLPGRVLFSEPERGDVAVFSLPRDPSIDYVKRIIGLPGEEIQVKSGVLYINDKPVARRRIDDHMETFENGTIERRPRYIETLPNGKSYLILEMHGDYGVADSTQVYKVPPGHYFAMGDNRDNSTDSRFLTQVGFIPRANLIGRAEFLFFSQREGNAFWEVWTWPWSLRFSRFFSAIE